MIKIQTFKIYLRLARYVKRYWWAFGLSILGLIGLACADGTLYKWLVPNLVDSGFVEKNPEFLSKAGYYILALFLFRGIMTFIAYYFMGLVGRCVVRDFRCLILDKLIHLPTLFFDKNPSGVLVSKVNYDTEQVAEALSAAISEAIRGFFILISMFWVMFSISARITLLASFVAPTLFGFLWYVSRHMRRYSTRVQNTMGEVTRVAGEIIHGQEIIRIYQGEEYEKQRVFRAMDSNLKQEMKMHFASGISVPALQFIGACALAALVILSVGQKSGLTAGQFTGMFVAMLSLLRPIKQIAAVNSKIQKGVAAANSIFELLDEKIEKNEGLCLINEAKGIICFEEVCFQYPSKSNKTQRYVIHDVSFALSPGETVALVGSSGSGKSTLVKLLLRLYDLDKGHIYIDGYSIENLKLANLRQQFAYVAQDTILFNDTIANNIAYGSSHKVSRKEIEYAAKLAFVTDFVNTMPQDLDTVVGERGMLLSGGQRQRIAIARAIIKDAPILILDEATSALDTHTEKQVQYALEKLRKGRTTIIIAHRLSTIIHADKIVVLQAGKMVESGTHADLLDKSGYYAKLNQAIGAQFIE